MTTTQHEAFKFAVLAADTAVFSVRDGELVVRLIDVQRPPHFEHVPGLPGGLLLPEESAEMAACRHVADKTGIDISKLYIEQLYTFSEVDRDPRGRVVAVVYSAYVPWSALSDTEREDATTSYWVPVRKVRTLAYDHNEVLSMARARLASRARYTTLVSRLMPKEFTLTELEEVYECATGKELDKRNFRKKILKLGILTETANTRSGGRFRPAKLYRFTSKEVKEIEVI